MDEVTFSIKKNLNYISNSLFRKSQIKVGNLKAKQIWSFANFDQVVVKPRTFRASLQNNKDRYSLVKLSIKHVFGAFF